MLRVPDSPEELLRLTVDARRLDVLAAIERVRDDAHRQSDARTRSLLDTVARRARRGRAAMERAIDELGWPYSPSLSAALDAFVSLEELGQAEADRP